MGVRHFSAETVINGLVFDLQRMVREKQDKIVICKLLRKNLSLLEGRSWEEITWWEEPSSPRNGETKPLSTLKEFKLDEEEGFEQDLMV